MTDGQQHRVDSEDDQLVALQRPADTDPRWVASADDKAAADDAIAAARDDPGSRLREWTPEMDRQVSDADTLVQERQWADEGIPATERPPYPSRLSATAPVPRAVVSPRRQVCDHCRGTGYMPGVSDYLRESIQLLGDQGDEVVRTFYGVLFRGAPELVKLFPADILEMGPPASVDVDLSIEAKREMLARAGLPNDDESIAKADEETRRKTMRGRRQRELLLSALVALSDLYDPDDPERMQRLDTALASFGRKHAAFARPDGTIKGATLEEYAAVKNALFAVLVQAAGKAWRTEYTEAWSQAYDYATGVMIAEQHRSGFAAPRFPRA